MAPITRKWCVENMRLAIKEVRDKNMNMRLASKMYSVPSTTLSRYVKSNKTIEEILPFEQNSKSKTAVVTPEKDVSEETDEESVDKISQTSLENAEESSSECDEIVNSSYLNDFQCIGSTLTSLEIFGTFVTAQLKDLPVDTAYVTMAEIQLLLTNKKIFDLRNSNSKKE